jgi:starch synthase (maltosyl-transferring)
MVTVPGRIPLIYNLFPRYYRTIHEWCGAVSHITEMAFTAVFVNSFNETGCSGSLYAVKNYFRLNPLFMESGADGADFASLSQFIAACTTSGLQPVMDLIINHTAIDSPLVTEHGAWYKRDQSGRVASPFAIDPGNPGAVTVWGDLASIDNEGSSDRDALWRYWDRVVSFYQKLGFTGFRCDAAYQVSASLWRWLIDRAKKRNDAATFYAETLGCRLDQIEALNGCGFDYLFNSVKWWHYDQSWVFDQHVANKHIAPSIAFAESHDTERLASVWPGTEAVQKSRYAFAALFSKALLMPAGFEYGAVTRIDVVHGTPRDIDPPQWDLTKWIAAMNRFKLSVPVLSEEGSWRPLNDYSCPYLFLEKASDVGNKPVYLCVNKNPTAPIIVDTPMIPQEVRCCSKMHALLDLPIGEDTVPEALLLDPAEIVMFRE